VKDALIDGAGLNVTEAADKLKISRIALSRLINGHTSISPEMAVRLSKLLNTSKDMWINLQAQYDTWQIGRTAHKIKPLDKKVLAAFMGKTGTYHKAA
ncbi:MAG: putative HTH-type transcriptional regulator, partial [Gammaproteobacteria bacterium]|nr:putative HTH-type transcriptional regulator [Gammaproteobacteria bacterium]